MNTLYATEVAVAGGRNGTIASDDGQLSLALAMPQAIGGTGEGTNPEQLFAAGFGACFATSLGVAAKGMGLDAGTPTVTARVELRMDDAQAFHVAAALDVRLPDLAESDRARVVAEAKRICAYHNLVEGTGQVEVALV